MTIRTRLALWFVIILAPLVIAGSVALAAIDERVTADTERELLDLLANETSRIDEVLAQNEIRAVALAEDTQLIAELEGIGASSSLELQPVENAVEALALTALRAGLPVEGLQVHSRDGRRLTRTENAWWAPANDDLVLGSMARRRPIVAEAFAAPGGVRVAAVTPIVTIDGSVVGALVVELDAETVFNTTAATHSSLDTRETNVVQRTTSGVVQMLGTRRFDRGSDVVEVAGGGASTVNQAALDSTEPEIAYGTDYRDVDVVAAVDTVNAAGWAVVVKIDAAEAFDLRTRVRRYIGFAALVAMIGATVGWMLFIRPLGRRLSRMSEAAEQIADGDYESPIDDQGSDEIGHLATSIDRLAMDLDVDIKARVAAETRLRWQANHDTLTGLANRQAARQLLARYDLEHRRYGLLFADLDGFKEINDAHGHLVGDEVLRIVAQRMRTAIDPDEGTVVRWGGDEFLIIVQAKAEHNIAQAREAVTDALMAPVRTDAGDHHVSATIGSKLVTEKITAQEAMRDADADMFKSKNNRSSNRKVPPAAIRLAEEALADDRVEVFFQPVVEAELDGRTALHGAEALLRVRNADGTILTPDRVLPDLGSHPLAAALDFRMLDRSLAQVGEWLRAGSTGSRFQLGVNLGSAAMHDPACTDIVLDLLKAHGVPAGSLVVEIPETVESPPAELLADLRQNGVLLAVDDVGCQHSNLERLVDVAAHLAKIDRRWIPETGQRSDAQFMLLAGLIEQCQMLSFEIVAEGIETEAQRKILNDLGVTLLQGYLFGKPMPAKELAANWLDVETIDAH